MWQRSAMCYCGGMEKNQPGGQWCGRQYYIGGFNGNPAGKSSAFGEKRLRIFFEIGICFLSRCFSCVWRSVFLG